MSALKIISAGKFTAIGKGGLIWLRERPAHFSASAAGAAQVVAAAKLAAEKIKLAWREKNYLLLRRGPYVVAAGMDESIEAAPRVLDGRFVNLFDAGLRVQNKITLAPGTRQFLLDLDRAHSGKTHLLASACKALPQEIGRKKISFTVEGIEQTPAVMLLESPKPPQAVKLAGGKLTTFEFSAAEKLLWIRFENTSSPRELTVEF